MRESCWVIYHSSVVKSDLTRRLSVHFSDFRACECNRALADLEQWNNSLWPRIIFIEWLSLNQTILYKIHKLLSLESQIDIYFIGSRDEINRSLDDSGKPFRIIEPQNLQVTDLPVLLGLTGKPIVCGQMVLWPASGNVFNGDGLPVDVKPSEWPIVKLASRERIRILEYLMLYAQGPENAKTATQILEEINFLDNTLITPKDIQIKITEIRQQVEPDPKRPKSIKSNSGRPGKRSKNINSGYYINIETALQPVLLEKLNEFSANQIFLETQKAKQFSNPFTIIKKLSEWLKIHTPS